MNKVGEEKTADSNINDLWQQYWQGKVNGDGQISRNLLTEHYYDFVHTLARIMYEINPRSSVIDVDDFTQVGIIALMGAVKDYNPSGCGFETYSQIRIKGAMKDEIRKLNWTPSIIRKRVRWVEQAKVNFLSEHDYDPNDTEILAYLIKHVDPDLSAIEKIKQARLILGDYPSLKLISFQPSFQEGYKSSEEELDMQDILTDKNAQTPLTELQRKDLKKYLTRGLTTAERIILLLYYYEELTMKEIGGTIGIHESRVCQLHSSILKRLNQRLTDPSTGHQGKLELMVTVP